MEPFLIRIETKRREIENKIYVEFVPDNEFEQIVKKCDLIESEQINDYVYLENVKIELFDALKDAFGSEFTNKYEL